MAAALPRERRPHRIIGHRHAPSVVVPDGLAAPQHLAGPDRLEVATQPRSDHGNDHGARQDSSAQQCRAAADRSFGPQDPITRGRRNHEPALRANQGGRNQRQRRCGVPTWTAGARGGAVHEPGAQRQERQEQRVAQDVGVPAIGFDIERKQQDRERAGQPSAEFDGDAVDRDGRDRRRRQLRDHDAGQAGAHCLKDGHHRDVARIRGLPVNQGLPIQQRSGAVEVNPGVAARPHARPQHQREIAGEKRAKGDAGQRFSRMRLPPAAAT